jgi:hypothetical protein
VKVITPTPLVAEAADVLAGFRDLVVVVGAAAIEVALSGTDVAITPTRDVDVVVPVAAAAAIVTALEADGLRRSDVPHERAFTWVRGDLKVQLVRTFHPFPSEIAKALPQNPVFGMAGEPTSQVEVAFASEPARLQLRCANRRVASRRPRDPRAGPSSDRHAGRRWRRDRGGSSRDGPAWASGEPAASRDARAAGGGGGAPGVGSEVARCAGSRLAVCHGGGVRWVEW